MKQLSNIFNVVDEAVGVTVCEYLGIGDGPGERTIHRFAIDWDGDRDERIVTVIEDWISKGWMDDVVIIGESKAILYVVTTDYGKEDDNKDEPYLFHNWLASLCEKKDLAHAPMPDGVEVPCIGGYDYWSIDHVRMSKPALYMNKEPETKERFRSLISLFRLGFCGLFVPARRG